jgi:acyl carrier protein
MTTTSDTVLEIFKKLLNNPRIEIQPNMVTGDIPGWDSFKNVELLLACEEALGIRFKSKEIDALKSLGDLIRACESKVIKP